MYLLKQVLAKVQSLKKSFKEIVKDFSVENNNTVTNTQITYYGDDGKKPGPRPLARTCGHLGHEWKFENDQQTEH
jgi:hypothetical protein